MSKDSVENQKHRKSSGKGIISALRARFEKNRLGELLVQDGFLTPAQLRGALITCKASNQPMGRVLIDNNLVSAAAIRRTLMEQFMLRFTIAIAAVFLSLGTMGFTSQGRTGSATKSAPSLIQVANTSFAPIHDYPNLFNSAEKRSGNLKAFTKWTGMFERFETSLQTSEHDAVIETFKSDLSHYKNLPLHKMAVRVNDMVNKSRYIIDANNYGQSDYWATPIEFLRNGGDCEDFAITKYAALRALGVPEERLRLLILQDMQKDTPHAVLVVYTDHGPYILDNQIKTVMHSKRIAHYKPIFSINRDSWWLHTKPREDVTVVASAAR